ncbi:hypothetical protein PGT21_000455 [Puccinia graminis f. sp. tritici]|uniref:Uncharacterized protein n=1 Tax=Puccinia graminis f. sp. tritici TaxID=56615 RepID=A0A5B0MA58_PUCGR|nr:hypothetical protein PGT21_000455 [Puccinia graminis f. sp. tritici]
MAFSLGQNELEATYQAAAVYDTFRAAAAQATNYTPSSCARVVAIPSSVIPLPGSPDLILPLMSDNRLRLINHTIFPKNCRSSDSKPTIQASNNPSQAKIAASLLDLSQSLYPTPTILQLNRRPSASSSETSPFLSSSLPPIRTRSSLRFLFGLTPQTAALNVQRFDAVLLMRLAASLLSSRARVIPSSPRTQDSRFER